MINKLIIDTLAPIGIPICLQKYSGSNYPYITFFSYNEQGESFSDDEEDFTGHYIQVDVWSKGDYTDIVKRVKDLLEGVGFSRTSEGDLYEPDTKIYHKGMRFFYLEEKE